ncbi:MAG: BON domain-containing protein [Fuerstiella sp.]
MSATYRLDTDHSVKELMEARALQFFKLQGGTVEIDVEDDDVFLTGNVARWSDKQRLQESIRPLAGRRLIRNQVSVQ